MKSGCDVVRCEFGEKHVIVLLNNELKHLLMAVWLQLRKHMKLSERNQPMPTKPNLTNTHTKPYNIIHYWAATESHGSFGSLLQTAQTRPKRSHVPRLKSFFCLSAARWRMRFPLKPQQQTDIIFTGKHYLLIIHSHK